MNFNGPIPFNSPLHLFNGQTTGYTPQTLVPPMQAVVVHDGKVSVLVAHAGVTSVVGNDGILSVEVAHPGVTEAMIMES